MCFPYTFPTKSFAASHRNWLSWGDPAGCLLGSLSFPSGQHGAAFYTLILGAALSAARAFVTQLWSRALGTLGVLCTYRAQSRATSPGLGVLLPLLPSRVSAQNSVAGGWGAPALSTEDSRTLLSWLLPLTSNTKLFRQRNACFDLL